MDPWVEINGVEFRADEVVSTNTWSEELNNTRIVLHSHEFISTAPVDEVRKTIKDKLKELEEEKSRQKRAELDYLAKTLAENVAEITHQIIQEREAKPSVNKPLKLG